MRPSRRMARAFNTAAGPPVAKCSTCGGLPYPPRVRVNFDPACPECRGLLDEAGRPIRRFPRTDGSACKVIVLSDEARWRAKFRTAVGTPHRPRC